MVATVGGMMPLLAKTHPGGPGGVLHAVHLDVLRRDRVYSSILT